MNKTSCLLLLLSVQFILYSVVTARRLKYSTTTERITTAQRDAANRTGTNESRDDYTTAAATHRRPVFVKRQSNDDSSVECSRRSNMNIDFPADMRSVERRNGVETRATSCSTPDDCTITLRNPEFCNSGEWIYIINSICTVNVSRLVVRIPSDTIISISPEKQIYRENKIYRIDSNYVVVDFRAENAEQSAVIHVEMEECCPIYPGAENPDYSDAEKEGNWPAGGDRHSTYESTSSKKPYYRN